MALDGNLSTVTILSSDLLGRMATLDRYKAKGQETWASQIAAGTEDALNEFRRARGLDPTRAKAEDDTAWTAILVCFTLAVIFGGIPGDPMREEERRWKDEAMSRLQTFMFRYDYNEDDELDDTPAEDAQRLREIRLIR